AANRPEKNMTSEQMNSSIPRMGLLMPPRVSWDRPATALCSSGTARAWLSAVIGRPSVPGRRGGRRGTGVDRDRVRRGPAVAEVEQGPLGADLGQPVEVVRRRGRAGGPLHRG